MPWYMPYVPDGIKKRISIYLLQRYLGQFLEEKITLDQLTLDLYAGKGSIENVSLDVQALNELGEKQNWPMQFVHGSLEKVSFNVPWITILKDSTYILVQGLNLTLQPTQRNECATSMIESMWSSMTNSMQLAQECMNQEAASIDTSQPLEGIEIFAQAIDSLLCRVKIKFVDTVIQIEHVPRDSLTGVGIVINIACIEYMDEAGDDPPTGEATDENDKNKAFVVSSFTTKNFHFEGITLSTVEFPSRARTFSKSVMTHSQETDKPKDDSIVAMMEQTTLTDDDINMSVNDINESVKDTTTASPESERHVILFGKFVGRQEIKVRLKQSEDVLGPKVSVQVNLGGLSLFLSPRQVFVLLELANGLSSPDTEDTSNVAPRQKCTEKPMTGLDYQRVEQELQQQLHPANAFNMPGLQGTHGWSTAALDESDNDENFLPMRPPTSSAAMYDSAMSNVSSSMESSLSSSMASSVSEATTNRSRRRANNIESDPTAEISQFQIKLASLAVVLLHEDLLTLSNDSFPQTLVASSVKQMQCTAERFFNNIGSLVITGYGKRNFDDLHLHFENACKLSNLRLLAAPIQIECNETTTLTAFSISGKLTAAKMEILECLTQGDKPMEYVRLLNFTEETNYKPCFKMAFKHTEKTVKTGLARRVYIPKTDITITLDTCVIEVDITIVDRICALIHPLPVCVIHKTHNNVWGTPNVIPTDNTRTKTESQLDLKLTSQNLTIKLRFPIPDFRSAHDMQRVPWWKRNVRSSYLTLQMTDALAQTTLHNSQICQKYIVQCKLVNIYYYEKENAEPLHIAKVGVDERLTSLQDGFNCPRVVIQIYPVKRTEYELDDNVLSEADVMTQSFYGCLLPNNNKKGPFSAKRVVHQSDTPHSKSQDDTDELVIPGDKQEISDFIELTTQSAQIQLEISLPTVTMQLISKHIYEVLYNHISSDLLLWEPSAPIPKFQQKLENSPYQINNFEHETYAMCKSGIQYESDSDSSEDLGPDTSVFYSVYDSKHKLLQRKQLPQQPRGQSYLTLNLHIGQGLLCMNPPVRDVSTNVIPEQHGEFMLCVEDASVFSVTGYCGDQNLGYVCVQSKGAQLHHCDMITTPSQCPSLKEIGAAFGKHLNPTIYKSDVGTLANSNNRGGDREMLSVAVRIQANHETHHVKTVRVALGINKATLRHRMCLEPNSWITQLIDFFNVNDYTIPGFHAKDVLTELHLHLWDCAIDYRPFHLPLRSIVTLGTFSMSSHLSAVANTSTLRFIAEECGLFLSEKAPPRNGKPSNAAVDLRNDYVNVVDLGLFELSLRTNDKCSGKNPHIDLRASNNKVHIRTCSDSGRALTQLITYFANDGDLIPPDEPPQSNNTFSSPRHNPENELVSVEPQDISNLSKSQHQQVKELLGDAMEESLSLQEGSINVAAGGAKMFFFPDEGQVIHEYAKPLPQVTTELGDVTFRSNKSSDTDEEYCIIGEEAGLGILPKNGLPEIRWLTEDPLRVIDNHFNIPLGKTDILKPPKHYPVPVMRYTLCNMTVVWQMYGGNDFKILDGEKKEKKTVNFSDMQMHDRIGYSNTHTGEIIFNNIEKKKTKVDWIKQGGVNRDHGVLIELELSKVRFQHEVYPENTTQASRQVLLVTELEVRDLLQSSEINKFLYQHTSQARPKQSHAHMIVIKAVHIRPDLKLKAQECSLRVSVLPLRLNIDQDSLLFLINFFNELSGTTTKTDEISSVSSKNNTPTHQPPVMTVSTDDDKELIEQAQKLVDDNLLLLLDDVRNVEDDDKDESVPAGSTDNSVPIYFRRITFSPDVPIRLDYHGKRLDLSHGPLAGLIMGLGQLNSSELRLRRLSNIHGILGFDKLMTYCLQEWINDIKKNQLPSLLGGVGPMHSLVQFFQGIRDLFWLPIEQYQKDGRIVRGLQRGANSFTTSTAMAALELTSRIIHLIQLTAETAYDMMSPGPSVRRAIKSKGRKRRYNQPQDIREGMANAYNVVKEGLGETAEHIVRVASHEREQKGYSGAVGGVLRQIPPTIVKPFIIASEATNNILGGMQSELLPDSRREANQKWKNNEG